MRVPWRLAATLFVLILAGCADPAPEPATPTTHVPEGGPMPTTARMVTNATGTFLVKTHNGHEPSPAGIGSGEVHMQVDPNATAILLEGAWRDGRIGQDLDLILLPSLKPCDDSDPRCPILPATQYLEDNDGYFRNTNGIPGLPDSPSRIRMEGSALQEMLQSCTDPCEWAGFFGTKGVSANIEWFLAMTVFHGEEIPLDYTALPVEWAET